MKIPSHVSSFKEPYGEWKVVSETFPVRKSDAHGYCKYCYKTHGDWWEMDFKDYSADVLLCEHCQHTMLAEFVE